MELTKEISALIVDFAEQSSDWNEVSTSPVSILKINNNSSLPFTVDIIERESSTCLRMHLLSEEKLGDIAQAVVAKNSGETYTSNEGPFDSEISNDGFSVFCMVTENSFEQFSDNIEGIIERLETMLKAMIQQSLELVSDNDDDTDSSDNEQDLAASDSEQDEEPKSVSPKRAIIASLESSDLKFRDNKETSSIELGINLDKYSDHDGKSLLIIHIHYGSDDLIRFQTPMMYKFDLSVTPYPLIASVIAWYQFEYKFLSMSLDPSDGELKISIDIPLGKGVVHPTQVERIMSFIVQFTEETFDELFDHLLHSPDKAQVEVNKKITSYQQSIEAKKWVRQFETDLVGLSEDKRKELQLLLEELKATEGHSGNDDDKPMEGI